MKRVLYILAFATLALSCAREQFNEHESIDWDSGDYFVVTAAPSTKVEYEDEFTSTFEDGDVLGVFVLNSSKDLVGGQPVNAPMKVTTRKNITTGATRQVLVPVNAADELGQGYAYYLFYYPYDESYTLDKVKSLTFSAQTDQSEVEGYEASDLLWDMASPSGDCVNIYMDHAMCNIILNIDENYFDVTKPVTIANICGTATKIDLTTLDIETMRENGYTVDATQTKISITPLDFGYAASGKKAYKAAVPACWTIGTGAAFLELTGTDGSAKKYRLGASVNLEPGRNYYFVFPGDSPNPVITDDDSWVLDVLDPDDGDVVGLLCREYLHYQPDNTDLFTTQDKITGTIPTSNPDSRNITSQAWVFYNLQSMTTKVPELSKGTVLRFTYDVHANGNGIDDNYDHNTNPWGTCHAWPDPHYIENRSEAWGPGLFIPAHGHYWRFYENNGAYSGASSGDTTKVYSYVNDGSAFEDMNSTQVKTDYQENWMHGGTIYWGNGTLSGGASDGTTEYPYYQIVDFEMPKDLHVSADDEYAWYYTDQWNSLAYKTLDYKKEVSDSVTNATAYNYGHIAYKVGETPFVSYVRYDETTMRDEEGYKVCLIVPHCLIDRRKSGSATITTKYPLVKIGYNNFWMSKDFIGKTLSDGTELECFNSGTSEGSLEGVTFAYGEELSYGYLYPRTSSGGGGLSGSYDVYSQAADKDIFPLLYNTPVVLSGKLVPKSVESISKYYMPTRAMIADMYDYIGWKYAAKLMSNQYRYRAGGGWQETVEEALAGFRVADPTAESYTANVSGFNLKAGGGYYGGLGYWAGFGQSCMFWLAPESDASVTNGIDYYSVFQAYDCWSATIQKCFSEMNFWSTSERYCHFLPVRFVLKYENQADTGGAALTRSGMSSSSPARIHSSVHKQVLREMK